MGVGGSGMGGKVHSLNKCHVKRIQNTGFCRNMKITPFPRIKLKNCIYKVIIMMMIKGRAMFLGSFDKQG